jgi:hypothetical protein
MSSSQYNGYETPDDRIISRYNKEIHPHQNHFMVSINSKSVVKLLQKRKQREQKN